MPLRGKIQRLRPPRFPDEQRNASSDFVHWLCWILILIGVPGYLAGAIAFPAFAPRLIGILAVLVVTMTAALFLNYRGWTRASSIALPLLLWFFITLAIRSSGGMRSPDLLFYPLLVMIAGFAGGLRNGIFMGMLCALTLLGFAAGFLPSSPNPFSDANLWAAAALALANAVGLQYLASRTLRRALERASHELAERTRAEKALADSERTYRAIVQELGDGVATVDGKGLCVLANPAMEKIFGAEPGGLFGRDLREFVVPSSRHVIDALAPMRNRGETIRYQVEIVRMDGTRGTVHVTAGPQLDDTGKLKGAVAVVRDVTDPRALEGQIRLLAQALGSASESIWIAGTDGRLLYLNDALRRTFEYGDADLPALTTASLAADGLLPHELSDGWRGEVRSRSKTGREFPMQVTISRVRDEQGAGIAWIGVGRDITQEKQAEATLRESERRFRAHLETVQLAAVMIDRKGAITFTNDYFLKLTGWGRDEVEGNPAMKFIASEDKPRAGAGFAVLREQATLPLTAENIIATKDGRKRLMQWHNTPLLDPAGALTGFCGVGVDITEHRALMEQRQQSERLESVGRLAAGVAHDFNNLLTVINGYSELSLREMSASNPLMKSLQEIRKAGEQAAALTRQLLTFSRQQLIEPGPLPLNQVILESESMFQQLLAGRVRLTTSLAPEVGYILGDQSQLQQVLMNLMTNALHAMPDGGAIRVETCLAGHPEGRPGGWALLAVTDNGVGMDRETLAHIFEPFFTTKDEGKGTGLGLSIVYGIVRQCDGYLTVESEPGLGTTFRIWWPLATDPRAAEKAPDSARPSGGSETILVVEDREEVRDLVVALLEQSGYRVLAASGATGAIETMEDFPGRINLLLTDVLMPGMNGRDLANVLTQRDPGLKVIFMSGYGADVIPAGSIPGIAFLQKPLVGDELIDRVRQVLDSRGVRT